MRYKLALALLLLGGGVVKADNVTFLFSAHNVPMGDLSWEITVPALDQSLDTQSWNFVSEPTGGGGCSIDRIMLEAEGQAYGLTTFFSPLCNGKYDSLTWGTPVSQQEFGTYLGSSFNADNSINTESLTIEHSSLPVTAPEPSTLVLVLIGLLAVAFRLNKE